jgi:hypothetical protein
VKGVGDQIDYGDRIYDPRIGKFLSVDPFVNKYPAFSPYNFSADNPVMFVDINGDGPGKPIDQTLEGRLKQIQPSFVDVLIRCNNASLRSFEGYAWAYSSPNGDARDNKYLGLAGESVVKDYLSMLEFGVREKDYPLDKGNRIAGMKYQTDPFVNSKIYIG